MVQNRLNKGDTQQEAEQYPRTHYPVAFIEDKDRTQVLYRERTDVSPVEQALSENLKLQQKRLWKLALEYALNGMAKRRKTLPRIAKFY